MASASGRCVVVILVAFTLLCGSFAPVLSHLVVRAEAERVYTSASNDGLTASLTLDVPDVTSDDIDTGAILIAQLVAVAEPVVSSVWICPVEAGWTQIAGVLGNDQVVQHLWWRAVTEPQTGAALATFVSREGDSCDVGNDVVTDMTGAITLLTGVDTGNPVGEAVSAQFASRVATVTAPATFAAHPAGSRIVRFLGGDAQSAPTQTDATMLYTIRATTDYGGPRFAAAFEAALAVDGIADAFDVEVYPKARWVATTVVLNEPSDDPIDAIAPVTSANGGEYSAGIWTNQSTVNVALRAVDTGGSGVQEIVYRTTGAHAVDWTTAPGAVANLTIDSQGETTVTYFARDHANNSEEGQTFVVRIDTSAPSLTGAATTAPNGDGWYRADVEIGWTCYDAFSGIDGACPDNSSISGEGDHLSASVSVRDNAGNQQVASVTGIRIDRTAPLTTLSPIPTWSNEPLTVTLTPTDNLSGVAETFYTIDGGRRRPAPRLC